MGLYTEGAIADQIAMLYVYLPIIREEIYEFVEIWNNHHIRHQPQRPYLPFGKPVVLYFTPGAEVNDYSRTPDQQVLAQLQADVAAWGA